MLFDSLTQILLSRCFHSLVTFPQVGILKSRSHSKNFFEFDALSWNDIVWAEWGTVSNSHVKRLFTGYRVRCRICRVSVSCPSLRDVEEGFSVPVDFSTLCVWCRLRVRISTFPFHLLGEEGREVLPSSFHGVGVRWSSLLFHPWSRWGPMEIPSGQFIHRDRGINCGQHHLSSNLFSE